MLGPPSEDCRFRGGRQPTGPPAEIWKPTRNPLVVLGELRVKVAGLIGFSSGGVGLARYRLLGGFV